MQLRILGPVIYTVVGRTRVEVDRIDPEKATQALRSMGYRDEAARLVAHHKLDTRAAIRLGREYGLLTGGARLAPRAPAQIDEQARADVLLVRIADTHRRLADEIKAERVARLLGEEVTRTH